MNLKESIIRVLNEEKEQKMIPLIKTSIKSIIDSYDRICGVKILPPSENTEKYYYLSKSRIPYTVLVYIVGGVDSEYWPRTQAVYEKEMDIIDVMHNTIREFLPINVEVAIKHVKSCKDNLNESVLREELSARIKRRIPVDEMETEFLGSFESAYNVVKKSKVLRKNFLDELIHITTTIMMDGIHWRFVSTLPEDEFWYDDIHAELENHYKDRIIQMYNERKGINESVLREESNKLSNFLNQTIEKYGLDHTLKLTGMDLLKLVNISGIEITSKIANKLLLEGVASNKVTTEYNGFKIDTYHDVVQWEGKFKTGFFPSNVTEVITVMATPLWDGMEWTPIDLDWYSLLNKDMVVMDELGANGDYYTTFEDRTSFDSVDDLFDWYENVYLPNVYYVVMNELLPKAQEDMVRKMEN